MTSWSHYVALVAFSGCVFADLPKDPLGSTCNFERLAMRPRLFLCRNFANQAWIDTLRAEASAHLVHEQSCKSNKCRSLVANEDLSANLAMHAVMEKLYSLFPTDAADEARRGYSNQPLNVLNYSVGGKFTWHTDVQQQHPNDLVASAILYIGTPTEGGETTFRKALPAPVMVPATAGDLVIFMSCNTVGDDEKNSEHMAMKVLAGEKLVLEKFFSLPRWLCPQDFVFPITENIVIIEETAAAAQKYGDEIAAKKTAESSSKCQDCLDSGMDYCATWNVCIERAVRACNGGDHVTGSKEFLQAGYAFSMECQREDPLSKGKVFLEAKSHEHGVIKLPSGLMYRVLRSGHGRSHPTLESNLVFHFRVQLVDGREIQSTYSRSEPMVSSLQGYVPGFAEGVQLMVEGDQWTLYVPSELAYGKKGQGMIPAGAALVFLVELIAIHEKDDL